MPEITQDVESRFWAKVDKTDDCWNWTSALNKWGYGNFWDSARHVKAHRFAYELLVGPIPEGLVIDHLCRNTKCVRPDHLEAVSGDENNRRAAPYRLEKTVCKRGHLFSEHGSVNSRGSRVCRECSRLYDLERNAAGVRRACPICLKEITVRNLSKHVRLHARARADQEEL